MSWNLRAAAPSCDNSLDASGGNRSAWLLADARSATAVAAWAAANAPLCLILAALTCRVLGLVASELLRATMGPAAPLAWLLRLAGLDFHVLSCSGVNGMELLRLDQPSVWALTALGSDPDLDSRPLDFRRATAGFDRACGLVEGASHARRTEPEVSLPGPLALPGPPAPCGLSAPPAPSTTLASEWSFDSLFGAESERTGRSAAGSTGEVEQAAPEYVVRSAAFELVGCSRLEAASDRR